MPDILGLTEPKRITELESAFIAVDKWLKSDDIHFIDKDGNIINDIQIVCKPFSISNRFIYQMITDHHWQNPTLTE